MNSPQNNFKLNYQNIKIPFVTSQRNDFSSNIKQIILNHIKKNKKTFSILNSKSKNTNIIENKTLPKNEKTKNSLLIIKSIKANYSQDKLKIKKSESIKNNLSSNEINTVTYKTSTTQTIDEIEIPKKTKHKKFSLYSKKYRFSNLKNIILNFNDKNFKTINKDDNNNYYQSYIKNDSIKKVSPIGVPFPDCPIKKNKNYKKVCAIKYINFDCTESNIFFNNLIKNKNLKKRRGNSKILKNFEKNIGISKINFETKEKFYNCRRYIKRNKTTVNKKGKMYKLNANKTTYTDLFNSKDKVWNHSGSNVNFNFYNININKKTLWKKKNTSVGKSLYEYNSKNPRISLQTLKLIQAVNSS